MNYPNKDIFSILKELKDNYCASGIKAELETEAFCSDELYYLKELSTQLRMNYTVKLGGCGSIQDLYEAKNLVADTIVAPMIETQYSLQKFIESVFSVFTKEELQNIKLLINIETISGLNNIKLILNSPYAKYISGIVIGRSDLAASMNISNSDIESDEMLKNCKKISNEASIHSKNIIIGGGLSAKSIPFFNKISNIKLNGFETRKIIFDSSSALNKNDIDDGITKAILLEIMLLNNKKILTDTDKIRIQTLEKRLLLKETFNV